MTTMSTKIYTIKSKLLVVMFSEEGPIGTAQYFTPPTVASQFVCISDVTACQLSPNVSTLVIAIHRTLFYVQQGGTNNVGTLSYREWFIGFRLKTVTCEFEMDFLNVCLVGTVVVL